MMHETTPPGSTLARDYFDLARFLAKIRRDDETGCWGWTAFRSEKGYGQFRVGVRTVRAHRFAYEAMVGPIPDGLTIDHLCRNRGCQNPDHLEPVTSRENTLRGDTAPAHNAAKTHCPAAHPYTPRNTYVSKRNRRDCRACHLERDRRARQRRTATATIEAPQAVAS